MFIGKINGTSFSDKIKQRLIKFLCYGNTDVRNYLQVGPFGDDSNPPPGLMAIWVQTSNGAQGIVTGVVNTNLMADVGEKRIFSTDDNGNLKASIWLKNDGKIALNEGNSPAVLGDKLTTALNDAVAILQSIDTWGATVTPPLPSLAGAIAQLQADIQQIESQNIKLN